MVEQATFETDFKIIPRDYAMSVATNLFRAAIEQGAVNVFRAVQQQHLLPDEVPVYLRINQHLLLHGRLPSVETLQAQGIALPISHEPASYYVQELRRRFAYNILNRHYRNLLPAMQGRNPENAINIMADCVQEARSVVEPARYSTLSNLMDVTEADYNTARAQLGMLRGVTTGYPTLDDLTLGVQPGDVMVIAGRPGMGKSYILLHAAHAAWRAGYNGAFVSMEMSLLQIGQRWIGIETGMNPRHIRSGEVSWWAEDQLRANIQSVREGHASVPFQFLSGDFSKSVEGVERMVEQFNPSVLYVDAAYLLTAEGQQRGYISKWESISGVIAALKRLALRKGIPVIITVQLNRNVKTKQQKEIDLGDVAGSDSIPQDSSILLAVREGAPPYERTRRILQMLKNRDGELRDFGIDFTFSPTSFRESVDAASAPLDTSWML